MHYLSDVEAIDVFGKKIELLRKEIAKVIIGQDEVVKDVLISIFSKGHVLLVGVPGLAKTLLVNTISKVLGLSYSRIQFTPDLMPSDIIGTEILDQSRNFKFIKGPVFANIGNFGNNTVIFSIRKSINRDFNRLPYPNF